MKVAILQYNAGNVLSVQNAFKRLGIAAEITSDPDRLSSADRVVFPGVGEASSAMIFLKAHGLDRIIQNLQQPLLGICLGLQLLCRHSEENNTPCLDLLPVSIRRLQTALKVPHIGWNKINRLKGPLFKGIPEGSFVYFVHSYCAEISSDTVAETSYEQNFSAALSRRNFFAVQFHPEKSGPIGEAILSNFLAL